MRLHSKPFLFLSVLLVFGAVSCSNSPQNSTSQPPKSPEVKVIPKGLEKIPVSVEDIPQPNCQGTESVSNKIRRSRTIARTIELGGGVTVSADGEVGLPGLANARVGAEVANHYGFTYGSVDTLERELEVKASAHSSVIQQIKLLETWETGEVLVTAAGKEIVRYPYKFRSDFSLELAKVVSVECPSVATDISNPLSTALPQTPPEPTLVDTPVSIATLSPSLTVSNATATPTVQYLTNIQDVDYQLVEAVFESGELKLWFTAKNYGADKDICLRYSSNLIDKDGQPQQQAYRTNGKDTGVFDCFDVKLPNQIPVRFGVVFSTPSPSTKVIPFVEIVLGGEGNIQLRDVPIPYKLLSSSAKTDDSKVSDQLNPTVSQVIGDVTYELVEAKFVSGKLQFWFVANNTGADKTICLRYSSNLIDKDGVPHQQSYRTNGKSSGVFDCFDVKLPNLVPVRFGIGFSTLSPSTKIIPLLEVVLGGEGTIQIREIPVPYRKP